MTSRCLYWKEVRHATWQVHSTGPAQPVETGRLFLTFGGLVCADRISNCPLDRVLTYLLIKFAIMSTPLGGGHIISAFFRRPPSRRLVSTHLKEKYLSYLYQIWYGCLLG